MLCTVTTKSKILWKKYVDCRRIFIKVKYAVGGNMVSILVIEDDENINGLLCSILKGNGYEVHELYYHFHTGHCCFLFIIETISFETTISAESDNEVFQIEIELDVKG